MQKDLSIPPVEALKRAFRSVKCLTQYDAVILANDAYGILVKLEDTGQSRPHATITRHDLFGHAQQQLLNDLGREGEGNHRLVLDIILARAVLCYRATADKFNFQYLGDRKAAVESANFALLARDLANFAPHAVLVTGHFTSLIRRLSGSLTRRPQPWSNLTAGLVAKSALLWIVLFNCQVSAGVGARRIWAGRLARKAWTFFRSACKASW